MSLEKSHLHVEGTDDQHALIHLLIRHGIDYETKPWPPHYPEIKEHKGGSGLIEVVAQSIQLGTGLSTGFVFDADSSVGDRWASIRSRLSIVDIAAPPQIPQAGYIDHSPRYKARVGIWIMPDNSMQGTLESFLETLVPPHSIDLLNFSKNATSDSICHGAKYRGNDYLKAVLHTWLAWQEMPGRPYGTAIKAHYFAHESLVASEFVDWFKRLYSIP